MTGSGYQTAYQFQGTENDAWAYYKPGRYYSPLMGRPLSSTGPLTAPGGYDSGLAGVVSASMPGSGGGSGCDPVNLSAFQVGAETFAAAEAFDLIVPVLTYGEINPGTALPAAVVAAIAETLYEIFDLFGIFGGGHPYIPPLIRFELGHQGGSPQALGTLIGMYSEWATGQRPVSRLSMVHRQYRMANGGDNGLSPEQYERFVDNLEAYSTLGGFVGAYGGLRLGSSIGGAIGGVAGGVLGGLGGAVAGGWLAYRAAHAGVLPRGNEDEEPREPEMPQEPGPAPY